MAPGRAAAHWFDTLARRAEGDAATSAGDTPPDAFPTVDEDSSPASAAATDPAIAAIRQKLMSADRQLAADMAAVSRALRAWATTRPPALDAPAPVIDALRRQRRHVRALRLEVASVPAGRGAQTSKRLTVQSLQHWDDGLAYYVLSLRAGESPAAESRARDADEAFRKMALKITNARRALGLP